MSKFHIKLKLQGFELEVQGNREDAPMIGRNLGDQIAGLLAPGIGIVDGESTPSSGGASPVQIIEPASSVKRSRRRSRGAVTGPTREAVPAVEFRHDSAKYGSPSQQWNTAQKATWLLYVLKEVAQVPELSAGQIVKTFNTHFRQAKTVTSSNVSRDLGRLKVSTPSQVGEDNTKSPPRWYLTEEGIRQVQAFIADTLTSNAAG